MLITIILLSFLFLAVYASAGLTIFELIQTQAYNYAVDLIQRPGLSKIPLYERILDPRGVSEAKFCLLFYWPVMVRMSKKNRMQFEQEKEEITRLLVAARASKAS